MPKNKNVLINFVKERLVLSLLFIPSCILLIKNAGLVETDLPILWILNPPTQFAAKIAPLINVLCGAYVTGIVMLLMVEEIPRERRRREAMASIFPIVESLYNYICELVEMIRISAAGREVEDLVFSETTVYVKVEYSKGKGCQKYYHLQSDCKKIASLIDESLSRIISSPLIFNVDEQLLTVLSALWSDATLSRVLTKISMPRSQVLGLEDTYENLRHSLENLDNLYLGLNRIQYSVMTEQEIMDYKKGREEGMKRFMEYLTENEPVDKD